MQLVFYNMVLILELLSLENRKNEKKKLVQKFKILRFWELRPFRGAFVIKILVFWFVA